MLEPEFFIFEGRSGSGKGTQASLLAEYLRARDRGNVRVFATGEHFRELAQEDTHTGSLVRDVLAEGGLPPEFIAIWIWANFFIRDYDGSGVVIFDGFPRRPHEADMLDIALRFYRIKRPHIIVLNVSREWAFERLVGRGRVDDSPNKINRRLDWYESEVLPTIEFFRGRSDYYESHGVDGEQSVEKVHADILATLPLSL